MYFMSTACGRPQGGGDRLMWMPVDRGEGGQKPDFFVDVINGWNQTKILGGQKVVITNQSIGIS